MVVLHYGEHKTTKKCMGKYLFFSLHFSIFFYRTIVIFFTFVSSKKRDG